MPFWKKDSGSNGNGKNKEKINYKVRLEHKQYLAQENPDPIYDLVDCGLKAVPNGLYSKFHVAQKEVLLLHQNELSCLSGGGTLYDISENLSLLNLSYNSFEKLPEELGYLKKLRVLYLAHNKLKRLPDSFGKLINLVTCDISHNSLKELPGSLGNLVSLKSFNVSRNPKLKALPKELGLARGLETLIISTDENLIYPSIELLKEGTTSIMKFFCSELNIEYISPSDYSPSLLNSKDSKNDSNISDFYDSMLNNNFDKIQREKESKKEIMIALEKDLLNHKEKERIFSLNKENERDRLLRSMATEEALTIHRIKKLQELKEKERETLTANLQKAENCSDALIKELMSSSKDPSCILEEMEAERKTLEEIFTIQAEEAQHLKRNEVLKAMEMALEEEYKSTHRIRSQIEKGRADLISSSLSVSQESNILLTEFLESKGRKQKEFFATILENEKVQQEAFTKLYLSVDKRSKEICESMEQVQRELAALSMIERTKRDNQVHFESDVLSNKREALTQILSHLMKEKEIRESELRKRCLEIEERKQEDQENYWLIQYQKLMNSKPLGVSLAEESIESSLKTLLFKAGAGEYLPVFAKKGISYLDLFSLTEKQLSEMGVTNAYVRQKILMEVSRSFSKSEESALPSAPPSCEESHEPSAPPLETFTSNECIVCLDAKCDILFLPCGHVCTCQDCQSNLESCPLCRSSIVQKVRLH